MTRADDRIPVVAFGLLATTVALKAKTGHLTKGDICALSASVLAHMPGNVAAHSAVLEFVANHRAAPVAAGTALQDAILELVPEVDPYRAEQVLSDFEGEDQMQFPWQGIRGMV
ncbi:hypothetical protein TG4357_02669 [Thalassovita gelatinovora]|uniref:Uncharacterized protein n=1 Tax=Thalassovita gelatinovora TaxID=53501 RepID=A0A0P1G0Q0_THAGE|nr:hypothetical protein [Thalassovita gelatinovora]QIZ79794.1 hypothetical protein HFZ77_04510 [Thalassovita gelatinovora]CUH66836.1 hypothetical protein TG4357_02669 [Thalassovita gelatinovora]SEQ43637.1 hypothetical protein SAMN04488043_105206 [Thalassovita gelatinovora]